MNRTALSLLVCLACAVAVRASVVGKRRWAYCKAQPVLTCNFSPIGDSGIRGYVVLTPTWVKGHWKKKHWRKGYWKNGKWVKGFYVNGRYHVGQCATRIFARVTGLSNPKQGNEQGWHIHEYGDVGDRVKGKRTGGHYTNPWGLPTKPGLPSDPFRHWGELGNLKANNRGVAVYNRLDKVVRFTTYINGRALTIHAGKDYGREPNRPGSGARVAQCVIGIRNPN